MQRRLEASEGPTQQRLDNNADGRGGPHVQNRDARDEQRHCQGQTGGRWSRSCCLYAVLCPAAEVVVNADAAKAAGIGSG